MGSLLQFVEGLFDPLEEFGGGLGRLERGRVDVGASAHTLTAGQQEGMRGGRADLILSLLQLVSVGVVDASEAGAGEALGLLLQLHFLLHRPDQHPLLVEAPRVRPAHP